MAIALYMDVHIPRAITIGLRLRGVNVITAQEDQTANASDSELLDRATTLRRVLFTFDDDLLAEAARRQEQRIAFPGVVFAHPLRISIGKCVQELETLAEVAEMDDLANQVVFLPLGKG